jgi:hypothetical protein
VGVRRPRPTGALEPLRGGKKRKKKREKELDTLL